MPMKSPICAVLFFGLVGCVTPPQPHDFANSQTYNSSFDQVWSNLIRYFAENDLNIKTIDKSSGVIYTDQTNFPVPNADMDCGNSGIAPVQSDVGSFNVFVITNADKTVTATVNSTFQQIRLNTFNSPPTEYAVDCTSTGTLELSILSQLGTPSSNLP